MPEPSNTPERFGENLRRAAVASVRDIVGRWHQAGVLAAIASPLKKRTTVAVSGALAIWLALKLLAKYLWRLWRWYLPRVARLFPILRWITLAIGLAIVWQLGIELLSRFFFGEDFNVPHIGEVVAFVTRFEIPLGLGFAGYLAVFLSSWHGKRTVQRDRRLRNMFRLCVPAESLELAHLRFRDARSDDRQSVDVGSDTRPYFGYISRIAAEGFDNSQIDAETEREFTEEDLAERLRDNKKFLLIGGELSGKTLTVFHVLSMMDGYLVVSPDASSPIPNQEDFALLKGRKVVVLLDDLSSFGGQINYDLGHFVMGIEQATKSHIGIVATCADGSGISRVIGEGRYVTRFYENALEGHKLRLRLLSGAQKEELNRAAGNKLSQAELRACVDPGDITMSMWIGVMRGRFDQLTELQKNVIRSMKLVDAFGIPPTVSRVHVVLTNVADARVERPDLVDILVELSGISFLRERPSGEQLEPNVRYITRSVSYPAAFGTEAGHWKELADIFECAGDAQALAYMGNTLGRRGDFEGAVTVLDAAIRVNPENAEAFFSRGYSLARSKRLDEALVSNGRALELRPDFAEAHNNRSYILGGLGRLEDALKSTEQALQLRPDYDDAHVNRAITFAQLGFFTEAIKEFNSALGLRPDSHYASLNLGITLSRQEAFEEALEAYDFTETLHSRYPELHLNRGITLARMDHREEALASFDRAIELRPDYAEAHMRRGHTLAVLRRYEEALASFDRALELQPDYAEAHMRRGHPLAVSGHRDEALASLDRALELQPEYAEAHMHRGHTLAVLRRYEEALASFDRALELQPDYAEAHMRRGHTLASSGRGDHKGALAANNRALELQPDYPEALYGKARALCFLTRNEPDEFPAADSLAVAMDLLERAVAMDARTITLISRDKSAFFELRRDPDLAERLHQLVWGQNDPGPPGARA